MIRVWWKHVQTWRRQVRARRRLRLAADVMADLIVICRQNPDARRAFRQALNVKGIGKER